MIGSAAHFGNTPSGAAPLPAEDYRRQARRLRRMYAQNPSLLHRRLHQLSESQRSKPRPKQELEKSPSLAANSPGAWYFAHRVAARLEGGVLRYSHRAALLKEADRLGIKRFEANLIIAVTQHRHRTTPVVVGQSGSGVGRSTRSRWILPMALAIIFQATLLGFLYYYALS